MGLLDDLQGAVVGLDTAPLIYLIEKHPRYHAIVKPIFVALDEGKFTAVTSTLTLTETLIHPLRYKETALVDQYQDILLNARNVTMYDLSPAIAVRAAEIRAEHNFRTPDAIQLATALSAGASFFLTNDESLGRFTQLQILIVGELEGA